MPDALDILINGRFLTRPISGVDRTATEIVRAMASRTSRPVLRLSVAVPRGAPSDLEIRNRLGLPNTSVIHRSRLRGYLWEQGVLARLRPNAILLSLCNMGPVFRRSQFVLIHDAQVHDTPASYSRAFRLAYRLLQPMIARRAAAVTTVSAHSRDRLKAHGVATSITAPLVPNGFDHLDRVKACPAILERLGLTAGEYLLALGHPAPHKNLGTVLAACRARSDRSLPLVVTGSDEMLKLIPPTDLEDGTVRFIGRISDSELVSLYCGARLFLLPSRTEGFGIPLIEAMACGCPVIASTGGALPEVAGTAAILVDPDDPAAWASAIDGIVNDSARLASLTEAGQRRASAFTWRNSAQSVVNALAEITSRRSSDSIAQGTDTGTIPLAAKP
ncbi:MAG: glycosyltransferase family 4 protein [Sphingomonadales bacterium]|nr:glycosyltransferase family 4 protein [Sphingomonadales bacterium]